MPDGHSAAAQTVDTRSVERSQSLDAHIRYVVIDCSSMMFIDTVGTTTIKQV